MIYPYNTDTFKHHWNLWKYYRKKEHRFKYKSEISEQAALKELSKLSQTEEEAIEIIERSMCKGWKGLFKIKKNGISKWQQAFTDIK